LSIPGTRATRLLPFELRGTNARMMFSTWGFKAVSGIGKRAATIEDRSIVINLKRKAKSEKIARLRHAPKADFADVARKLARVAKDQMATFSSARPDLPEALNDRAQDNWEHLFAIADIAGSGWPDKAKQAALSVSGVGSRRAQPEHRTPRRYPGSLWS
jgi:Protein of unknown function (DUF3631)